MTPKGGYTTTTPTFDVTILPDDDEACDNEVDTYGDPEVVQDCELDGQLQTTGAWVSYLKITTSSAMPSGSVQYRVYFSDGVGGWVDKGIWPEGTYHAGDNPGDPHEIPFGTTVKVVAEPTPGYTMGSPKEWEYTFGQPNLRLCGDQTTLGTMVPTITFTQTCTGASYTLGLLVGTPGDVTFVVNGGAPTTTLGTFPFPADSPLSVTIDAYGTPPNGIETSVDDLDGTRDGHWIVTKTYVRDVGCLTTMALTGTDPTPSVALAGMLGLFGLAFVRAGVRMQQVQRREEA